MAGMPVKSGLGVTQGHWNWYHLRDLIWVPIGILQ